MEAVQARFNFEGNVKLGGNIATWSVLFGDATYDTPYGPVKGTCTGVCEFCGHPQPGKKRPPCYVAKSYRQPDVIKGHARNTLAMREDPQKAFADLDGQLSRKRKPVDGLRWNQSGEVENLEQFRGMTWVSGRHEETPAWIYTKQYGVVVPELLENGAPDNFTTLISIWHEQGIEEYKKLAHLPNVKAFVYLDPNKPGGWGIEEYAAHGLIIQTLCHAYNEKGKLNHDVTCNVCTKCFNRLPNCKVIGCYDHG